ncbi:hypothetical protein HK100_000900, partial [Physocladia obscura]
MVATAQQQFQRAVVGAGPAGIAAQWQILTKSTAIPATATVSARNIVLAIGSVAKTLPPSAANPALSLIPLEGALQIDRLAQICTSSDNVAVFGSWHSTIMIVRDLLETVRVRGVVNVYRANLLVSLLSY